MKTIGIFSVLLVALTGFMCSCGDECELNATGFQQCYTLCNPQDQDCVANCINLHYCSDWGPFCSFGYVDYWGYCY